jgi:hypothetical protein
MADVTEAMDGRRRYLSIKEDEKKTNSILPYVFVGTCAGNNKTGDERLWMPPAITTITCEFATIRHGRSIA